MHPFCWGEPLTPLTSKKNYKKMKISLYKSGNLQYNERVAKYLLTKKEKGEKPI